MRNTVKFIHTGDLHLGTAFRSVPRDASDGKLILQATYETCAAITDLAIAQSVDFVIYAGDVYDNPKEMFVARSKFVQQMKRLEDAGINAYVIYGNHDPLSEHESRVPYPPNVFEFVGAKPTMLSYEGNNGSCVIAGQSYLTKYVVDNLAKGFPPAPAHQNSVAILHTDLGSEGSSNYAPCSLQDLKTLNYAYYALGHTHNGGVLETSPMIAYCTSPQALDINENGAHGVWIVELCDGKVVSHERHDTGAIGFSVVDVSVSGCTTTDEVYSRIASALSTALENATLSTVLRLRYFGSLALDISNWRNTYSAKLHESAETIIEHHPKSKHLNFWLDPTTVDETIAAIDFDGLVKSNDFAQTLYEISQANATEFLTQEALSLINQASTYVVDETSESDESFDLDPESLRNRALELAFSELFTGGE